MPNGVFKDTPSLGIPVDPCPFCARLQDANERAAGAHITLREMTPQFRALQDAMHHLQRILRANHAELRRLVRVIDAEYGKHPKCADCGALIGVGHSQGLLSQEPYGQEWVCLSCREVLLKEGRSVVERTKALWIEEKREERDL